MFKQIVSYLTDLRDWLFKNEPSFDTKNKYSMQPTLLFFISIIFYCIYLLLLQPGWVLSGEMWAEMATNYYFNATSLPIIINLFSTDAGYIPLLPRLLAIVGRVLKVSAMATPYFYTWSSIILIGVMIASFCLTPFRTLVKNDYLRFVSTCVIFLMVDFDCRIFINFTYFSAFFIAIVTALALVEKKNDVPSWAWFIPILILSKPAVLSVIPAMIVTAFVSKKRFRRITFFVVIIGFSQIVRLFFSRPSESDFFMSNHFTIFDKLYATAKYFIGLLGGFFAGKVSREFYHPYAIGFVLFIICLLSLFKKRTNSSAIIFVGLSLLFFNVLLNTFVLSDWWNRHLAVEPFLNRHIIVGFFGFILVIVGLINSFFTSFVEQQAVLKSAAAPFLFLSWFYFSGWLWFSGILNRAPQAPPILNISQWQKMASVIDSGAAVCVPINPFGWVYTRNCSQLNSEFGLKWMDKIYKYNLLSIKDMQEIDINLPASVVNRNLLSIAILIKPLTTAPIFVTGKAIVEMKDGSKKYMLGDRQLPISGGLLMFTTSKGTAISTNNIQKVTLKFSVPVKIGYVTSKTDEQLAILWMGN